MHQIRVKLLKLSQRIDTSNLGLRQLAKLIGEKHPQLIKYHLKQMEREGLIHRGASGKITVLKDAEKFIMPNMVSLPILGSANCGPAFCVAEQDIEGYLQTSAGILSNRDIKEVFVIKAVGNSLNAAQDVIGGPTIEDGDMVIIDKSNQNPKNGDYVLSIIDDAANLKRFYRDADGTVRLVSESTENIPPILIHPDDFVSFMINGVVVRVIKN